MQNADLVRSIPGCGVSRRESTSSQSNKTSATKSQRFKSWGLLKSKKALRGVKQEFISSN